MAAPQAIRVSFELALRDVAVEQLDQDPTSGAAPHVSLTAPAPPNELAMTFRLLFNLAPAESRALAALLAHDRVSREALHAAIAPDGDPVTDIKSIDVVIHHLRKKLARHGIAITAIWGLGFMIDKATRDRVDKILADHNAEVTPPTTP